MSKRKYIVSILIILTLLFETQFICINYNIFSKNNHKNNYALNKKISLTNKAVVFSRDKLKNCISVRVKQTYPNQNNTNCVDFHKRGFSSFDKLIDYREHIRQSIPHYFNGSNYKIDTSAFYTISI